MGGGEKTNNAKPICYIMVGAKPIYSIPKQWFPAYGWLCNKLYATFKQNANSQHLKRCTSTKLVLFKVLPNVKTCAYSGWSQIYSIHRHVMVPIP